MKPIGPCKPWKHREAVYVEALRHIVQVSSSVAFLPKNGLEGVRNRVHNLAKDALQDAGVLREKEEGFWP